MTVEMNENQSFAKNTHNQYTCEEISSSPPKNGDKSLSVLSRKDYAVIFVMFLDTMCHNFGYLTMSSFFPVLAIETKGLSMSFVGFIISALPFSTIVSGAFISKFCKKVNSEKILLSSLVIMLASVLPFAFVMNIQNKYAFFAVCFILRYIQGIGFVAGQLVTFNLISSRYPFHFSTVFGLIEIAIGNGAGFGIVFGGYIYDSLGFEWPFFLLVIISSICFLLTFFIIGSEVPTSQANKLNSEESNDEIKGNYDLSLSTVFRHPEILLQIASCCITLMNVTYFEISIAPFLTTEFGLSSSKIGLLYFISMMAFSVSCPLVGYFNDKKRVHVWAIFTGYVLVVPATLLIGPIPILPIPSNVWLTFACLSWIYVTSAMVYVPLMGLMHILIGEETRIRDSSNTANFVSTSFVLGTNFGDFIGPFLGGIFIQFLGFKWASAVYGLLNFIMALLYTSYIVYRKLKRKL